MANERVPNGDNRQEKRRHHFTPVLYLRNFTDANGVLHAISRTDGHRYQVTPERVGFERDLYRPGNLQEGEDPNTYEEAFARFEGQASPVIREVIQNRRMPMDGERLDLLFDFIAFQAVRTPSMRRVIAAPREQTWRVIMDMLRSSRTLYESQMRRAGLDLEKHPFEQFIRGEYEPRLTTEGFLDGAMTMMTAILQYLHRRTWFVLPSDRPGEPFVVSDHPVALTWSDGREPRLGQGPGHAHRNTDLTFPVSSNVALLGRYENTQPAATPENVAAINSKTVNQSGTFVAACSDDFLLIRGCNEVVPAEQFVADLAAGRC